jgi:hypothetical protein
MSLRFVSAMNLTKKLSLLTKPHTRVDVCAFRVLATEQQNCNRATELQQSCNRAATFQALKDSGKILREECMCVVCVHGFIYMHESLSIYTQSTHTQHATSATEHATAATELQHSWESKHIHTKHTHTNECCAPFKHSVSIYGASIIDEWSRHL